MMSSNLETQEVQAALEGARELRLLALDSRR